jgi:acyl transferase domain-containing protein/SAM-dependent methyltransferase
MDGDHIECIIRETGINQDGGTPGITIPSASAQQALIRNTYLKAGLDISKPSDRPQYFEAHGTGTPAGDPVEAEAIHRAFFEDEENAYIRRPEAFMSSTTGSSPLFVGSIKTILGHTEGTAGLAGILKASLALQNGVIPPNLHFDHLSERVASFYKNLEVVQGPSREWPSVHGSSEPSRRASVNSFGFGGTNAHAILESYSEDANDSTLADYEKPLFTPFVFSASSENSLRAILKEYLNVLKQRPLLNIHDLAWTLRQRRSLLPHRASFAAPSVHILEEQLSIALQDESSPVRMREKSYGVSSNTILGIFTGQGAQYARLGAELIEQSSTARSIILTLDTHLSALPTEHTPSWSLITELLAPVAATRVMKAAIAQPLCTAVQIMLVDLLALAGVHFDVVVGHSSGEIAAAYAAGVLSARDAILVAYFRGLYVGLSASPNGSHIHGAMVAVGTSLEDAEDLCNDERYAGRLAVAACNSSSSVTISGDEDAIEELQELMEDEKKFHRRLRVDVAYHSRHMDPCFTPYVEALRQCGVQALRLSKEEEGPRKCQWFSSVYDCAVNPHDDDMRLNDQYWAENMTRPVFFSQALRTALLCTSSRRFSVALEIGPHPALQGPAGQTIQETLGKGIPYHPTLFRGKNAVTALSSSLGFLWQQLRSNNAADVPDLDRYERAMISDGQRNQQQQNNCRFKVVKGLPTYQWDHTTKHWAESRASRKMRLRRDIYHPLLGHTTPDSSKHHLRWRNLLREGSSEDQEDILQLDGHRVQGQTVFPAAGYVATIVEAARALVSNDIEDSTTQEAKRVVRLVEIHNMVIHQAIVLSSDGRDGVEVLIELADVTETPKSNRIRARFSYSADLGHNDELTLTVSAEVEVLVGHGDSSLDHQLLPPRRPLAPHLIPVEKDRFYTSLATFGYEYEGAFKSLAELKRNYGKASCMVEVQGNSRSRSDAHSPQYDQASILVHPADLDAAFQSLLLAYSYPGDHQLRALHLPLSIECVRVNPALCGIRALQGEEDDLQQENSMAAVDATVILPEENGQTLPSLSTSQGGCRGDISIFTSASPHAAIQVHNVQFVPVGGSSAEEEDRKVFSEMQWVNMAPDGLAAAEGIMEEPQKKRDQLAALHRLAVFYYRQFDAQVPIDSPLRSASKSGATALFLQYAQYVLSSLPDDWPDDGLDDIHKATEVCGDLPDVGVMHLVGQTMPHVFRGETTMLEAFRESGVLDDYYVHSFASAPSGQWQTRLVEQIATRHPHLNILEIGAGTGGTTKPILNALGPCCRSYTFTDVSAGFFSAAATALSLFQDRLTFKSLDIESDPRTQGFQEGTYDLIIASFVLHATASLSRTLANVRKLLRPGGYLVVGEGSIQTTSISSFIFGPLPGWWLGRDDGRILSPHVSATHWDQLLRENGFSGIDTKAPDEWEDVLGVCLFSSQAIDDQVRFLRTPLSASNSPQPLPKMKSLWIVGGKTARTAQLVAATSAMLKPYAEETHIFASLADVDYDGVIKNDSLHNPAVLSLVDLDKPVFKDMTERDFLPFQRMFREGKTLLWVTTGRRSEEPFSNMIVGFGRTAVHETPGLYLQHLDLADPQMKGAAYTIAENFLRFAAKTVIKFKEDTRLLWPTEPEIVVDLNGRHQVARLFPLRALNDRYNSGHRLIAEDVDISRVPVLLRPQRKFGGIELEKLRSAAGPEPRGEATNSPSSGPLLNLRITHALIPAIRTPFGHGFLALGAETSSGVVRLALLSSLASVVTIPTSSTLEFTEGSCMEAMITLSSMAHHLVALSILDPILPGQTVLIHNATSNLVEAIHDQATEKGTEALFVTDKGILLAAPPKVQILSLSQYMSQTELWKMLPAKDKISSFVSLTSCGGYDSESLHTILAGLPAWCRLETADVLFSQLGSGDRFTATEPVLLKQLLQKIFQYTHRYRRSDSQGTMPRVVDLEQLVCKGDSANEGTGSLFTVVNLATSTRLFPAAIRRLDAGGRMFRADRTYWVVGLSGDLGISLCDWMIRTGAKHLVITSRKPNIEQAWMDLHRQDGVIITILPW